MSSQGYPRRTRHLPHSDAFTQPVHHMNDNARALLSYEKAQQIGLAYGELSVTIVRGGYSTGACSSPLADMSIEDVLSLSPKFWQLHNDPVCLLDGGAFTLLTIQFNLCAGTVARYARRRPELTPLVEDLLRFRKQYVLDSGNP